MDAFNDELESFKDRIRKRAQAKLEEAMRQVEEVGFMLRNILICAFICFVLGFVYKYEYIAIQEERQKRLGPGGLDPVEVFESLPLVRIFSLAM